MRATVSNQNYFSDNLPIKGIILAVDDNPNNLQVLSSFLDDSSFEVWAARSGEKALQRLENDLLPDLILLDIMMPGMDGFETCQRLKSDQRFCDIPVVFMTALSETADKVKGFQLGAVDYITKPFQHEEVLVRIEHQLKLRHLTTSLIAKNVELQKTQSQLIQTEKIASLGQMAAGIAHEVNNPINFIAGNLNFVQKYVQEVVDLLYLYQKHFPNPPAEIQNAINQTDLTYLLDDLSNVINSMRVGTDRVQEIVSSLNKFSRHKETGKKLANLHEAIDNTLLIEIVKKYGNLPLIECYSGEISQVFMNLIANAIDAIEETQKNQNYYEISENTGVIRITTELIGEQIICKIADNGGGISEEMQSQIFNAFYTTKPIGKGTGLGLSIAYQIVTVNHHGKISCHSQPGAGLEFMIELPID